MYSHIIRSRRPAVVPPEPPLRLGATPRPGCKADTGRPPDLVLPAGTAGPWERSTPLHDFAHHTTVLRGFRLGARRAVMLEHHQVARDDAGGRGGAPRIP